MWLVRVWGQRAQGLSLGPSGGRISPWAVAMRWCPAGSKAKGTAHSEDMARAEAKEPRALADCLPGHSPDRASHKAISTNPERSQRAARPVPGSEEAFNTCYPPVLPSFLQSSWSSNSLQSLMLPVQPILGIFRMTASRYKPEEKSSTTRRPWMVRNSPVLPELQTFQWAVCRGRN